MEGGLPGMLAIKAHVVPGALPLRSAVITMCPFKQDDGHIIVLGGLRCAAVLTVISTLR